MTVPRIPLACVLPAILLAACAGSPPSTDPARPHDRVIAPPSARALVVALEAERGAALAAAEARLVALGEDAVPVLGEALDGAEGEHRLRLLGVLDELGRVPDEVGAEERLDVVLWRLAGGTGGPGDRIRMLARLPGAGPEIRAALVRRCGRDGPGRPLALFALAATGDARAVEILSGALGDEDEGVRASAAAGLKRLTGVDWLRAGTAERAKLLREWGSGSGGRQG